MVKSLFVYFLLAVVVLFVLRHPSDVVALCNLFVDGAGSLADAVHKAHPAQQLQ